MIHYYEAHIKSKVWNKMLMAYWLVYRQLHIERRALVTELGFSMNHKK